MTDNLKQTFISTCQYCLEVVDGCHAVYRLQKDYHSFVRSLREGRWPVDRQVLIDSFFKIYLQIVNKYKERPALTNSQMIIFQTSLDFGQMFCWPGDEVDAKYHCIMNYYQLWIKKYDKIGHYFTKNKVNYALEKITILLEKTDYQ